MPRKVIFCRGIQGSGKSTWAKAWVLEDPEHRVRINWDDLRNMLGKYWVPSREPIVVNASVKILTEALQRGCDVVIDNMNLSEKSKTCFMEAIKELSEHGLLVEIEYVDFKTPLEECITRDAKRENPIGAGIITATYERNKEFYN